MSSAVSYFVDYCIKSFIVFIIMACIGTAVLIFFYYSINDKLHEMSIPHPRPMPFFGNIFKFALGLERQTAMIDRIYKQFSGEKYCGYYSMKTPYLIIRDPELINNMLITDFASFTDHGFYMDPEVNMMGNSLFFMNGHRWKIMREKMSPGFKSGKLKLMHAQIKECIEELMDYINQKTKMTDKIDMNDALKRFAINVIGTCAFGLQLDAIKNEDSDFRKFGKFLSNPSKKKMFLKMQSPTITNMLKIQEIPRDVVVFYRSLFSQVIEYREKNQVERNDVADTLMQARRELVLNTDVAHEEKFTEDDIISNAILLFTAGSDPTSITTAFCFYELALNKPIQDKLRKHIFETKEKHGGQFNNDYLMDLQYADMVLTETLRKWNGAGVLHREATQNYRIPNELLFIEKGQKIVIPMYSIHHDPKYYPNPDIFDPERFSPEEKAKRPRGTELSFGDGPRFCIGKRLAEMEIKLVLSELLSNFEILPCEKTENPVKIDNSPGFMAPKNGIWLTLKPFNNK